MSRIGTDVVALAAILGSAVVGGVVTLAALDRPDAPGVADCPSAHVRTTGRCVDMVIVDQMVQADLERALNGEMAKLEKELARLGDNVGR